MLMAVDQIKYLSCSKSVFTTHGREYLVEVGYADGRVEQKWLYESSSEYRALCKLQLWVRRSYVVEDLFLVEVMATREV